jgi:MYXO-CTERM domain-containing protein
MNIAIRPAAFLVAAGLTAAAASADIVSQFDFNSVPADASATTGSLLPSTGIGTASTQGGITFTFGNGNANGGSTDPVVDDDTGWQTLTYPTQGNGSGTAGVRFDVSTAGFSDIAIAWDQRFSNTSSRFYQLQYTLDGSVANPVWLETAALENTGGGDFWANNNSVNLAAAPGVSNNPLFAFRIVSVFGPAGAYVPSNSGSTYAASGTWRFDMVTVRGVVPTPGAVSLLALGGLFAARRRR